MRAGPRPKGQDMDIDTAILAFFGALAALWLVLEAWRGLRAAKPIADRLMGDYREDQTR